MLIVIESLVTTTITNGDIATCNVSNVSELSVSSLRKSIRPIHRYIELIALLAVGSFNTTSANVDVGTSNVDNGVESSGPPLSKLIYLKGEDMQC